MTFNAKCINLYSETNNNMELVIIPYNSLSFNNINRIASNAYDEWMGSDNPMVYQIPIGDYVINRLKEKGGYKLGTDYKMYFDAQWYEEYEKSIS